MQPEPLIHILDKCGDIPIRRVVNTTGFVPTKVLLEVAQRTDMFLYTVRHMNSATHKQMTGQPNELILHNLHELAATGATVRIRMVLIKDVNDNEENIRATGSFLSGLEGVNEVYLLSLDDLRSSGAHNETTLSLQTNSLIPEGKSMARAKTILQDYGLLVTSH